MLTSAINQAYAPGRESAQADGANQPPIDLAHLSRYTLGNKELESEILQLFSAQAPTVIGQMRVAGSDKAWHDAAHTLKGSALAVGAWYVAKSAEQAERLGDGDINLREPVLEQLSAMVDEALRFIASLELVV